MGVKRKLALLAGGGRSEKEIGTAQRAKGGREGGRSEKEIGTAQIRTGVTGFKVQCDNLYTTAPKLRIALRNSIIMSLFIRHTNYSLPGFRTDRPLRRPSAFGRPSASSLELLPGSSLSSQSQLRVHSSSST